MYFCDLYCYAVTMLFKSLQLFCPKPSALFCFLSLIFCHFYALHGQPYKLYTVENGLPRGYISTLFEDKRGYIWCGIVNGVCRFDGERFKLYDRARGTQKKITGEYAVLMFADATQHLWLVADFNLYLFDETADEFVWIREWERGLKYQFIHNSRGQLWAINDSLNMYDLDAAARTATLGKTQYLLPDDRDAEKNCIINDTAFFYVTQATGLSAYNLTTRVRQPIPLPFNKVSNFKENPLLHQIWVCNSNRVGYWQNNVFTEVTDKFPPFDKAIFVVPVNVQVVFLITRTHIYKWDGTKAVEIPWPHFDYMVSVVPDQHGHLWVGAGAKGLCKIPWKSPLFNSRQKGRYIGNKPIVVDQQKNTYFFDNIGGYDKDNYGAYLKSGDNDRITVLETAVLAMDHRGHFWSHTQAQELTETDPTGRRTVHRLQSYFRKKDDRINFLYAAGDVVAVFTINGLVALLHTPTGRVVATYLQDIARPLVYGRTLHAIYSGDGKQFLLSTEAGLVLLTPDWAPAVPTFNTRAYLLNQDIHLKDVNAIYCAVPDRDKGFWLGTPNGLHYLDLEKKTTTPIFCDVLRPNDVIFTMMDSPEHLWLGTQRGLIQLDIHPTLKARLYTQSDGLPDIEFNRTTSIRTDDGTVYMGTVGGIVYFKPSEISNALVKDTVVITDVYLQDSLITGQLNGLGYLPDLAHDQNFLTITFALLNYDNPTFNIYQYRLNGGTWIDVNNDNTVTLARLAPGEYHFEVRGSTGKSEWSAPVGIHFEIRWPWWRTWPAYFLYAGLIAGLGYLFFKKRIQLQKAAYDLELQRTTLHQQAELDQFKVRLLSNVAHDLRSPITVIKGLAEKYMVVEDPKVRHNVELIQKSSDQLLEMVGQILDLSKIHDNGTLALRPFRDDLARWLHIVLEPYIHYAELEKKIEVRVGQSAPAIWTSFDHDAMKSIIVNLTSNAIKFTPEGGRVMVEVNALEGNRIDILVYDSGPGIPDALKTRIFERFFQVEIESSVKGHGIGLWHTAELVQLMDGQISVQEETTEGAVFRVSLPLAYSETPELPGVTLADTPDEEQSGDLPILLVVEDNAILTEFIVAGLKEKYAIYTAKNGLEGVHLAQQIIPDVILSDVMMPEMSGIELCQILKSDRRTSHIPVLLTTVKSHEADIIQGLESGADGYIVKPYNIAEIQLRVENLMGLRADVRRHYQQMFSAHLVRPNQPDENAAEDAELMFLLEVQRSIQKHFVNSEASVDDIAQDIGISKSNLYKKINALTGSSIGTLLRTYRLEEARWGLQQYPGKTIAEIAYSCGFTDPNYFSSAFSAEFGVSPREYRNTKR